MECFVTTKNGIAGRIDPFFYQKGYQQSQQLLSNALYSRYPLGELTTDMSGGATPRVGEDYYADEKTGIPFLRVQNITEYGLIIDDLKYIKPEVHSTLLKRSQLKTDDLVFTITGRIGNVAVIPEGFEGNINQHSVRIHLKTHINRTKIYPQYVAIFLNTSIGSSLSNRFASGGTRQALDYESVKAIQIPVPPEDIQLKIIKIMESAYNQKRVKETNIIDLVSTIDELILNRLGIQISFKPRMAFSVNVRRALERLDPLNHAQDIYSFLEHYKGDNAPLDDALIEYAKSGFAAGYGIQDQGEKGVLQIRPTNLNDEGRLVFDRNIFIKPETVANQQDELLRKGEVLFNNTNSQELVGKSALFNRDGQYFCSNHITRIAVRKERLLPEYLVVMLNLYQRRGIFFRICTNWNNQSGVNTELLKTVRIPVPSLTTQETICAEIETRLVRGNELKTQAREAIEEAKKEVERLIFRGHKVQ
jgi:restriction endonuclease S subunit